MMSIITAQQIIDEARTWKGTRWDHQQSIKGLATDCAGFVDGVVRSCGIIPRLDFARDYRRRENGLIMLQLLRELTSYVGDVAALRTRAQISNIIAFHDGRQKMRPRHLAFISQITPLTTYILHASDRGVVEHRMDMSWVNKIHSIWRIREVVG